MLNLKIFRAVLCTSLVAMITPNLAQAQSIIEKEYIENGTRPVITYSVGIIKDTATVTVTDN